MVNLPPQVVERLRGWRSDAAPWYVQRALDSLEKGWYEVIKDREGKELYLLRMWLSTPVRGEDGRWDSANSVLLHLFFRADNDAALHDHPWDFTTTVLSGAYREALPSGLWTPLVGGPALDEDVRWVYVQQTVRHKAEDLHAIAEISNPGHTWSLVTTGPRVRDWGFHPPGQPWRPWRVYLGLDFESRAVELVREDVPMRDPVNGALQVNA